MHILMFIAIFLLHSHFSFSAETGDAGIIYCSSAHRIDHSAVKDCLPIDFLYPRDCSFPLPHIGGAQYIPYSVPQAPEVPYSEDSNNFRALYRVMMLGYYMDNYGDEYGKIKNELLDKDSLFGNWINSSLTPIEFFKKNNIRYKDQGKAVIEGGNIHFITHKGKTKAIIGDHSLMLTTVAKLFNNHFQLSSDECKIADKIVNHIDKNKYNYCMARNLKLYQNIIEKDLSDQKINEESMRPFTSPLSGSNLIRDEKAVTEAKNATRNLVIYIKYFIAKELELAMDDVVIIPQRKYHIDMDLFVTHNNKIVLRKPNKGVKGETELWKKQDSILKDYFSGENLIDVPEEFFEPELFCGLLIPRTKEYIYGTKDESPDNFNKFLDKQCGLKALRYFSPELSKNNAGTHCMTQEYFFKEQENTCVICNTPSKQRCSLCKEAYYCGRDCQTKDWPSHKKVCGKKR